MTNGTTIAGSVLESVTTYTNITNENALSSFATTLRNFSSDGSPYISDTVSSTVSDILDFNSVLNYIVGGVAVIMVGMTCFFAYQYCKNAALLALNRDNEENSQSNDAFQDSDSISSSNDNTRPNLQSIRIHP